MQRLNSVIGILLLAVSLIATAQPVAPVAVEISRSINIRTPPPVELAEKRIYIVFEGSPRMTEVIRAKLRERGLLVTDSEGDAEATFKLTGVFDRSGQQDRRAVLALVALVHEAG